jgi:hypothetical protein
VTVDGAESMVFTFRSKVSYAVVVVLPRAVAVGDPAAEAVVGAGDGLAVGLPTGLPYPSAVANWRRSLGDALWAVDRALGGQRRPTRIQKWVARHPISAGLCLAVPFTLFFLMVSPEDEADSPLLAMLGGLIMGLLFALTAGAERLRQRRHKRLGCGTDPE